ncbi:P-loop containing nucleoside triphosphate hydrolase protein [Tilletiaria anomala UBC 951]|uniref:p-loop containing nucleoside triphosphate hydrolase protein n=1 Tax=Tilletiaria anomala (strain ATCC 24038 / CBS 436.72 / UBC 951) TaxID=1037660 RepID=A0A066WHP5_TILAU|nr:P-loop containing nucleoside triphosphate hydrolase protein [Tilletiaria anomala UBC 951]KDN52043.1 P-loop containing nucleoside triphosphate hydrolase protein [Tilletiaria anomala UBC 951]
MEQQVQELGEHLQAKLKNLPAGRRYLVSICGVPGSGKSSLAKHVVAYVNRVDRSSSGVALSPQTEARPPGNELAPAIVVGMDGWHLTREQLDQMPDPKTAHARRGAAFTFDGEAFSAFVLSLREQPLSARVTAPSFSHAAKDPVAHGLSVLPQHTLIVIEGLYCNVDAPPWRAAARAFDERWVVQVERAVAKRRLVARHVLTGVARDELEALWRAENNDLPNGDWLLEHIVEPARRLPSLEDGSWSGNA